MEAPDFPTNVIDALACLRWRNTPLTRSYLWTVEGPLADATMKVLLTSAIALEAGMTVVPRKEFHEKEPPIVLRPKVGIMVDVQYYGRPRRLKIRAPWTIWHDDEEDAGVNVVIFQTEVGYYADTQGCCFAYMGAIHRARKAIRQDACIYGIATDGQRWVFIRIDNESKAWVRQRSCPRGRNEITSDELETQRSSACLCGVCAFCDDPLDFIFVLPFDLNGAGLVWFRSLEGVISLRISLKMGDGYHRVDSP
ncbi:hypothetical protein Asppvi_008506 [Aspergillus pseudoviridinutans]|uniref:Uncharacterized protein n=1 Tax=Aspergillus pseudoviridinutans TaxID=1517512 RepID=A0A9P3BKS2_9EURO|nr:uncharacterized protein Asppvi_008506 [Aspergillus pseudoviridinutans]GIJ89564.1 hypothetical protein Asppvi_008506 [Aspergillus pseudoviridinutans]